MTEFNNNNKYIPKAPETFQVAYLETNQEVKQSPLSPAARSKVIRKGGGGYQSQNQDAYGPCSYSGCRHSTPFELSIGIEGCKWWARNPGEGTSLPGCGEQSPTGSYYGKEYLGLNHVGHAQDADSLIGRNHLYTVNTVGLYATEDYKFCVGAQNLIRECVEAHNDYGAAIDDITKILPSSTTKGTKGGIKTAAIAGSSFIPGATPLGLAVAGGATGAGGEIVKAACDSDKAKHAGGIVGEAGFNTARSVLEGEIVGKTIGQIAGNYFQATGRTGKEGYEFAETIGEATTIAESTSEPIIHRIHCAAGESYDSKCGVCNPYKY